MPVFIEIESLFTVNCDESVLLRRYHCMAIMAKTLKVIEVE